MRFKCMIKLSVARWRRGHLSPGAAVFLTAAVIFRMPLPRTAAVASSQWTSAGDVFFAVGVFLAVVVFFTAVAFFAETLFVAVAFLAGDVFFAAVVFFAVVVLRAGAAFFIGVAFFGGWFEAIRERSVDVDNRRRRKNCSCPA